MDDADLDVILRTARDLVRERVIPHEAEIDATGEMPAGPRDEAARMGLYDVAVPASALIGTPGEGYVTAMRCLAHGRPHIAALCVGLAQRALDETLRYALERRQGGHPIADYQLIQGLIADSQTEVLAGRALVRSAAADFDSGADRRLAPSCAKYFCSEMVGRVTDRAVQVHGGAGYMRGVPVERFYRDARLFRIYEGTSQIQQLVIARQALRERTSPRTAAGGVR